MGQGRVAGAEDQVGAELDADLGLQRLADVDLADDANALVGECGLHLDDGVIERRVERLREIVARRVLSTGAGRSRRPLSDPSAGWASAAGTG